MARTATKEKIALYCEHCGKSFVANSWAVKLPNRCDRCKCAGKKASPPMEQVRQSARKMSRKFAQGNAKTLNDAIRADRAGKSYGKYKAELYENKLREKRRKI